MAKVCIVTGAPLCRNPRVVKEATALGEAGYEVVVVGPAFAEGWSEQDAALARGAPWRHRLGVDLRPAAGPRRQLYRALRRAARTLVAWTGAQLPEALGYGLRRTLAVVRAERADLVIGHQEVGVWVAARLLADGCRVGTDLEDWYSRDLLPKDRVGRPLRLLARCEGALLRRGAHATTTSHALGGALAQVYGAPAPAVVYNAFPWADRDALDGRRKDRPSGDLPSLHWVSQTVGPGRGLEVLFAALQRVEQPVEVHLRGRVAPATASWLRAHFPSDAGHRLYTHGFVPPAELLSRITEHDVGLALEERVPLNKDLTVSNKVMHYLLAGLAVVATDTAGQAEVAAAAPGAVRLCRAGDADDLARAIAAFVTDPEGLRAARPAALEAARARFCWERQVPILLRSVEAALHARVAAEPLRWVRP